MSVGLMVTCAFSGHRRYWGALDWERSQGQGSELSYGRQPHLAVSLRQLTGFVLNPVHFFVPVL